MAQGAKVGSVNLKNLIKRFTDFGFTYTDCLSELIDNSIDAGSSNIHIIITDTKYEPDDDVSTTQEKHRLYIIDDGCGMSLKTFNRFFELFGDKEGSNESLGKKGIGAKIAHVVLSNLHESLVISTPIEEKKTLCAIVGEWGGEHEYSKGIVVQRAYKEVQDLWDKLSVGNKQSGTITSIQLSKETYDELLDMVNTTTFDERNVFYRICRNYNKLLQGDKLNITFKKRQGDAEQMLECKPIDPLYLDKVPDALKATETIDVYRDPKNNKFIATYQDNNGLTMGYDNTCVKLSHKPKEWTTDEIQQLHKIGNITLEHSFLRYTITSKTKPFQYEQNGRIIVYEETENQFLSTLFGTNTDLKTRDSIHLLSGGTHLERNQKETCMLIRPVKKISGDFDIRENVLACRHRVRFVSTCSNDDEMDKIFKTQINKSKVDVMEIPKCLSKIIEDLNTMFVNRIHTIYKTGKIPVASTPLIETIPSKTPIQNNVVKTEVDISKVIVDVVDHPTPLIIKSNINTIPIEPIVETTNKTLVKAHSRGAPTSELAVYKRVMQIVKLLSDETVQQTVKGKCNPTASPGNTETLKMLDALYKKYEVYKK